MSLRVSHAITRRNFSLMMHVQPSFGT
jgi:hypothetical protein